MRHKRLPKSQAPHNHTHSSDASLSNCSAAFGFDAQRVTVHVQAFLTETAAWTDSAIKRPKRMCACAIFAHTIESIRGDFGIWLARHACVQTLHTERGVEASRGTVLIARMWREWRV